MEQLYKKGRWGLKNNFERTKFPFPKLIRLHWDLMYDCLELFKDKEMKDDIFMDADGLSLRKLYCKAPGKASKWCWTE